jgi:ATP-dependent helicase HrpA
MSKLAIHFPEELPVSARRDEIAKALLSHQVLIVCGETGSGKTTQLPKIALSMGRGRLNAAPGQRGRLIGHTQPRRIAASTVAKRIAQELNTPLGEVVGYMVRFADKLSAGASVKLMTDGILLAETQTDPDLKAYDTLIIDEAHERSLNIDFLLGYLLQLLPRRPELKVIVTSATIDAERFARYFASSRGPAPVITVSGRLYPVEQRYRPFEERKDYGPNEAIADAVDELWRDVQAQGDILIFMPGEREIREAAEHLRGHLSHSPITRGVEVMPLFARLSQSEQERVFEPHSQRRIVLATNVAETSLTVPGIRYVIDTGTARVKRYSYRNKVEQLLVEPISQAAANQRAGRCGRVANGICIRLYDEKDLTGRAPFTDPEILRSSLAAVILRMKSLRLKAIEDFDFIEPPNGRAIADGYQLLNELGVLDETNAMTDIGWALAKLPLDPRLGRMILEAHTRGALDEVLVIASALSVQDVRDRPLEAQAAADQAQAKFDDDKSEFTSTLKLWKWLSESRGGTGNQHKLSNRQHEQLMRQHFINVRRVREWRDIHSQLHTVVAEQGWRLNSLPASYEQLHLSMLAGLLGTVGCKADDDDHYLGARGIKFYRHPGARLSKKPGRWVVCAELVETTRLFGRGIASIEPLWIEQVAGHLLKKQWLDPHWEKKSQQVVALERATLYGLVIYNNRRASFAKLDPSSAREILIREALVAQEWSDDMARRLPFLTHNQKLIAHVQELEHKARRQDVLVDDELIYAFYDQHIPASIATVPELEQWWRQASRGQPDLLRLSQAELMRHEAAGITSEAYPKIIRLGGIDCSASYLHEPGHVRDGVTVTLPLFALNQVGEQRCDWLVPGMLREKVQALLKSLPQRPRSRLVPMPQSMEKISNWLCEPGRFGQGDFLEALLLAVRQATELDVQRKDFKADAVSSHSLMNFCVVDEHGRQLGMGRNLAALKADLGQQARGAFQALAALKLPEVPAANQMVSDPTRSRDAEPPGSVTLPGASKSKPHDAVSAKQNTHQKPKPPTQQAARSDPSALSLGQRYTAWTFGDWPELIEIEQGGQSVVGFAALQDAGDAVILSVLDEPELAAKQHRAGLARLFALQIKDALKYIEKNLPDWQKTAVAYMPLGTAEELKHQVLGLALDRAFLQEPLPLDAAQFEQRLQEGRGRLTLIANEVARLTAVVLAEYSLAARKIKDSKNVGALNEASQDGSQQLGKLMPKRFVMETPWSQMQHLPRYLKAIVMRLDKARSEPERDHEKLVELRPLEQRYWRLLAERKGQQDSRMIEFRWLLEELRVSLFAQTLRTPQPVSAKRLEKAWGLLA